MGNELKLDDGALRQIAGAAILTALDQGTRDMGFRTYWDLSEKERAALVADEVDSFAASELMRLGVLKVAPLWREPEPVVFEPGKKTFYQIETKSAYARERLPLLFHSIDDARAVLKLDPWLAKDEHLNDDWSQRCEVARLLGSTALDPQVVMSEMLDEHDFAKARADLAKRSAVRAANVKREEDWIKEKQKEDDALKGMWSDWQRCRDLDAAHRRVADTLELYTATAGGDREVAFRFLRKAFPDAQIIAAAEWCGFSAPAPYYLRDDRIDEVRASEVSP